MNIGRSCIPIALLFAMALPAWSKDKEGVRAQLVKLQTETGVAIASFHFGSLGIVRFASRSWSFEHPAEPAGKAQDGMASPDGSQIAFVWRHDALLNGSTLGIVVRDGSNLREFKEIGEAGRVCWSPDKSKLALKAQVGPAGARPRPWKLIILDLASGTTQEVEASGNVTTQCWSPDGKELVLYIVDSSDKHGNHARIGVFNLATKNWRELTQGEQPTWSPDGKWIAFRNHDSYYLVSPSGEGNRLLFKNKYSYSPLWWSPDSRFVAYSVYCCLWKSIKYMDDVGHLRVRRLADDSDDWVGETSPYESLGWIKPIAQPH
jgi:dipeptidyl aminopeptidase/acylaminoacyl peptidase